MIDGIEMDAFWDGPGARCLFAHDLPADPSTAVLAVEASAHGVLDGALDSGAIGDRDRCNRRDGRRAEERSQADRPSSEAAMGGDTVREAFASTSTSRRPTAGTTTG